MQIAHAYLVTRKTKHKQNKLRTSQLKQFNAVDLSAFLPMFFFLRLPLQQSLLLGCENRIVSFAHATDPSKS